MEDDKKTKRNSFFEMRKNQIRDQVQIVDLARELGYTVKRWSKDSVDHSQTYTLEEFDSMQIYPRTNTFCRRSRYSEKDPTKCVGGDVFRFMIEVEAAKDFKDAYNQLLKKIDPKIKASTVRKIKNVQKKITPQKRAILLMSQIRRDDNAKNVMAYLINARKILPEVVYDFLNKDILCQETNDFGQKMAVFIGRDENGLVSTVCKRVCSSYSKFKQDASDNNYSYGYLYDPETDGRFVAYNGCKYNNEKPLICFESEIEKMSYISILKLQGIDTKQYAYFSTGAITKSLSIMDTVKRYDYKKVIMAFNNDKKREIDNAVKHKIANPGQAAALKIIAELNKMGIKTDNIFPEHDNDWNDMLCRMSSALEVKNQNISQNKENGFIKKNTIIKDKTPDLRLIGRVR